MSDPIFGIGAEGINPSALQSKFIKALADHQIELSEVALAQLFNGVCQKANEAIPSASLPFPLTSTVKGALTHAKKFHSILKLVKPGIKLGQAQTIYANTFGYKQWGSMAIALREFEAKRSAA